jgi:hypothetical protein
MRHWNRFSKPTPIAASIHCPDYDADLRQQRIAFELSTIFAITCFQTDFAFRILRAGTDRS